MLHNSPLYISVTLLPLTIEEREANFSGKLHSILLDHLARLGDTRTYVAREQEQILVSHETVKPV